MRSAHRYDTVTIVCLVKNAVYIKKDDSTNQVKALPK